jgi:N-acetylmuramoyl-L-alanine amidase
MINLDIGRRVADLLTDRGAQVTMTRNRDTYPERSDRADIAKRQRADLFVSIHCDSGPSDVSGTCVYVYTEASPQSHEAAESMIEAFRRAGIECLGKKAKNLHVLREHSRPAILVECGFLTNRGEAQKLNTPAYRAHLASTIADGVTAYCQR